MNPMCLACCTLRPVRFLNCHGICKALQAFLGLTDEEVASYDGAGHLRSVPGQKPDAVLPVSRPLSSVDGGDEPEG